ALRRSGPGQAEGPRGLKPVGGPSRLPRAGAAPDWVAACFAGLVDCGRFGLQWEGGTHPAGSGGRGGGGCAMERLPLGVAGTSAAFLRRQATPPRRQRGRGQGARRKSACTTAEGGYAALVDGLVFRVLALPGTLQASAGVGTAQAAAVEATFRLAFLH